MTKITLTRLTELAAEKGARDAQARITHLEAKLREIITDATSLNHALTIAREGLE